MKTITKVAKAVLCCGLANTDDDEDQYLSIQEVMYPKPNQDKKASKKASKKEKKDKKKKRDQRKRDKEIKRTRERLEKLLDMDFGGCEEDTKKPEHSDPNGQNDQNGQNFQIGQQYYSQDEGKLPKDTKNMDQNDLEITSNVGKDQKESEKLLDLLGNNEQDWKNNDRNGQNDQQNDEQNYSQGGGKLAEDMKSTDQNDKEMTNHDDGGSKPQAEKRQSKKRITFFDEKIHELAPTPELPHQALQIAEPLVWEFPEPDPDDPDFPRVADKANNPHAKWVQGKLVHFLGPTIPDDCERAGIPLEISVEKETVDPNSLLAGVLGKMISDKLRFGMIRDRQRPYHRFPKNHVKKCKNCAALGVERDPRAWSNEQLKAYMLAGSPCVARWYYSPNEIVMMPVEKKAPTKQ